MDEYVKVQVLHIVNPHLIFVESRVKKGVPKIQQVGIYGVLPVYKTIDIDGEIIAERCENWPVAANTILREFLSEHRDKVYFVPIHIDERSTIFDENVHYFGDIIIKNKSDISISNHLLEATVAVKDESEFHRKLSSGRLKLKLNTMRTEEVITAIEKYYKKLNKVDHNWQKTIKQQTSLHEETKKITELTEENLKLLDRSSRGEDITKALKTIQRKTRDFDLCKDADLVSVGCALQRTRSRMASTTPILRDNCNTPHKLLSGANSPLVTKEKQEINDSFKSKSKDQSLSEQLSTKRGDVEEISFELNNSLDRKDHFEKAMNLPNYERDKGMQHANNTTGALKPKERRLVYCPDMEMSSDNLKNLVPITVSENSATNYANTVENVLDDKTGLDEGREEKKRERERKESTTKDFNKNECKQIGDTQNNQSENKKSCMNIDANDASVTNPKKKLNSSLLEKKLMLLSSEKNYETSSISSNSDVNCNQNPDPERNIVKPIGFKNKNEISTEIRTVSHSETKNTKSTLNTNNKFSNSFLQKRLKALEEFRNNANSSSTSDTSVKDTNSSTDQSKIGQDETDQVKCEPEPAKVVLPKRAQAKRNVNPFKNLDGSKSVFVEKLVTPILMVHTKNNNLILPECQIRDIPFKTDIRMMLNSMRIKKPKRLQTVMWTYILRGHSMFVVGPAGNGKTIGYVPAICNLVVDSPAKCDGVGPICIIVCGTALSVSEVESHCKRFLGLKERVVTFCSGIDPKKTVTALLNGCHVLICTAPALVELLAADFGVDLRRLATLVLDDCERLSQVYVSELNIIIQSVKIMLKNRADKALKVQYIVASRQWCDFMTPLAKKAPDTVIAIGVSQECVLYSKTQTSVSFVKSQANKVNQVGTFLQEIDQTKRKIIVCREDEEVALLRSALKVNGHVVFSCDSKMDLQELCKLNEVWANYEEPVSGPTLVCCDGNLTHLNITNANYLVHFSMPALFSMFCRRFSVLNDNYASIFETEKEDVRIKIFLDGTNVEQLPKILHFVKRCTKKELPNLDAILQEVIGAKDLKKAETLNPICNSLLMFGDCVDVYCSDRHTVFQDLDKPKDWMPKSGLITFKITQYDTAVTYSARVLSSMTKTGPVKYPNNYNTLLLKMGMHYSKETNRKLHGVPKIGDFCAVAHKPNSFERCRVLKVIPGEKNTTHVLVNLIDEEQMIVVSDVILYHLPDHFKEIETHVVKVRLANIQPKDKDITFSIVTKDRLQRLTDRISEHGVYMKGQVLMTLGNTIFVDTAEACVDLSSVGETVMKLDYKKELLDRSAEPNPQHIEKLKKIAGITDTVEINEPEVATKDYKNPQWAHLDKDEVSMVVIAKLNDADTIFLRHVENNKMFFELNKDINEHVTDAPTLSQEDIYVGNFVLAEFPDDATYERARIDEIMNDKLVKCLFVDNGDWLQVPIDKLKPITDNIMHRIPFQAIECRLVGVKPPGDAKAWPEFSTCWLDDQCYVDKEDDKKQFFVKCFTKEPATTTGGHKYGVVLYDSYSEEDVVINEMMIDLNLAKAIEDERKYIEEPLDIERLKLAVKTSPEIPDKDVTEEEQSIIDNETPHIKDLVPLQRENYESNKSNIPLPILVETPIRSMPLVDNDSDSDILDKWDIHDPLAMLKQLTASSVTEDKNFKNKGTRNANIPSKNTKNASQNAKTADRLEKDLAKLKLDVNEKVKESSLKCVASTSLQSKKNYEQIPQPMSTSLDSDDIDTGDERAEALDVSKRKMSKGFTQKLNAANNEKAKNDTLDSDDLSSVATEVAKVTTEAVEPPRKPKLVWRQCKGTVVIKINLISVEDYTLEIKERHMKFQTWHNDTAYEFEFDLYGVIVPEKAVHSNKGQYIQVRLTKVMARNWLSLTKDNSLKKWIVYDVDAIELSSDVEEDGDEEARQVIRNNHNNADSSSDDDDPIDDIHFKYESRLR